MSGISRLFTPVAWPVSDPPRLNIVVDTEEEFDWSAPFSRDAVGVTAIAEAWRLQAVLGPRRTKPTYVIDYPVAATPASAETLGTFAHAGECEIGAHLHPWVSPPYVEDVCTRNSYACNLDRAVEHEKIAGLKSAIQDGLRLTPRVYKAGRYGFGPATADTLEDLGFDVDVSVNPHMNYSSDGGPVFDGLEPTLATFGRRRRLLEVPCTTGFAGVLRGSGDTLHRLASTPLGSRVRAVGILARSGLLNKIMLSPEGSTLDEMIALTRALLDDGVRVFSLTFHSPSLKPGCTRYVSTTAARDQFLDTIARYCDFFFERLGGVPSTPAALYDEWLRTNPS